MVTNSKKYEFMIQKYDSTILNKTYWLLTNISVLENVLQASTAI